jgi:molybdopterin/thiamine biosynthesis adenylyltransferase
VASDYHGSAGGENRHFLAAEFDEMVAAVNPDAAYDYLDRERLGADLREVNGGRDNAWLVLPIHQPSQARQVVADLAAAGSTLPVLLVLTAPGGFLVARCASPDAAFEQIDGLPRRIEAIPNGLPEMDVAAAGMVLSEIINGGGELAPFRLCAYYSQHQAARVQLNTPNPSLAELALELAAPARDPVRFSGQQLVVIGAGALANWFCWALAHDQERVGLRVYDGDPQIEAHNVSRQPLVAGAVGPHPKVEPVVRALQQIDPHGRFEGIARFLHSPQDLDPRVLQSSSAVVALPDNDGARVWAGEAALAAGLPLATAGSSVQGGQAVICRPDRGACVRCLLGLDETTAAVPGEASCAQQAESIVSSNMVAAGLLLAELRNTLLTDLEPVNLRFATTGGRGNLLERMVSNPPMCPHVQAAREGKG